MNEQYPLVIFLSKDAKLAFEKLDPKSQKFINDWYMKQIDKTNHDGVDRYFKNPKTKKYA